MLKNTHVSKFDGYQPQNKTQNTEKKKDVEDAMEMRVQCRRRQMEKLKKIKVWKM